MNNKKKSLLFIFSLLILFIYNYLPLLIQMYSREKKLNKLKERFNNLFDSKSYPEEYLDKLQTLILNYDHVNPDVFKEMRYEDIVDEYDNLYIKEVDIFYLYSLSFNLGIFLPFFLTIGKFMLGVIKEK